jgi:hypothetical protein
LLKRRAAEEGKSLGDVISEVVAPVLASGGPPASRSPQFRWRTAGMGPPKVDLEDKEVVRLALGDG